MLLEKHFIRNLSILRFLSLLFFSTTKHLIMTLSGSVSGSVFLLGSHFLRTNVTLHH